MNANLLAIIKEIISGQGDAILSDPRRVSAFLADLARDIPKPQKNALIKSLEHGSAQILKDTPEAKRAERKQKLAQKLHEEEGLDLALCNDTMELLATVLFGEEQKKIFCKNCKKELQQEWKTCPFCRAAVTAIESPAAVTSAAGSAISSGSGSGSRGYGINIIKPIKEEPSKKEGLTAGQHVFCFLVALCLTGCFFLQNFLTIPGIFSGFSGEGFFIVAIIVFLYVWFWVFIVTPATRLSAWQKFFVWLSFIGASIIFYYAIGPIPVNFLGDLVDILLSKLDIYYDYTWIKQILIFALALLVGVGIGIAVIEYFEKRNKEQKP